mgnify:CR=1 FL=1
MLLENLKLTIVSEWTESKVGKKKDAKTITHRDEFGCPFDHLEYKIVAAAKSRALTHKFLKKRKKR